MELLVECGKCGDELPVRQMLADSNATGYLCTWCLQHPE